MSAPIPMPLVDLERVVRAREMLRDVVPVSRLVEAASLSGASGARGVTTQTLETAARSSSKLERPQLS